MGFKQHNDGHCAVCDKHAEEYCDSCRRYTCTEHMQKKEIPGTYKKFNVCPDCFKNPKAEMSNAHRRFISAKLDWKHD